MESLDQFLDLVLKSRLMDGPGLGRLLRALTIGINHCHGAQQVKVVADAMVEFAIITRWQRDRLLEGRYKGFFVGADGKYVMLDWTGESVHEGVQRATYRIQHVDTKHIAECGIQKKGDAIIAAQILQAGKVIEDNGI